MAKFLMTPAGGAVSRRWFLRAAGLAALAPAATAMAQQPGQEPLAGEGENGTLRDPSVAGRSRERTSARDNDEAIKQIELQLHCTCGCSLDIYTCRTTDFTCTYSPELHKEVVALYDDGKTAQEILDAFVAKYGEKVLMAPKREGFNWFGYLVPGASIAAAGAALVMVIGRRKHAVAMAGASARGAGSSAAAATQASDPAAIGATPEELERVQRALREVED